MKNRKEKEKKGWEVCVTKSRSAGVDMDVDGKDEDGVEGEEDEGVDGDGLAVGLHAPEVQVTVVPRELEEEARLQQHEQHHPDQHRAPVGRHSRRAARRRDSLEREGGERRRLRRMAMRKRKAEKRERRKKKEGCFR